MAKSATFGVIHLGISFTIGWALTGSVAIAGAIVLLEPLANTVAHYFFDRWWSRREASSTGADGVTRGAWHRRVWVPALAPARAGGTVVRRHGTAVSSPRP